METTFLSDQIWGNKHMTPQALLTLPDLEVHLRWSKLGYYKESTDAGIFEMDNLFHSLVVYDQRTEDAKHF